MLNWDEIHSKVDFTEEELKRIPNLICDTLIMQRRYFNEVKKIPLEKIYNGIINKRAVDDPREWITIYDNRVFLSNIIENAVPFLTHKDFIEAARYFKYILNSIFIIFFKFLSCGQIVKEISKTVPKFTNSYVMESFGFKRGFSYVIIRKLPFYTKLSFGHECRYTEGTFAANFELHNVKNYKIEHILCEEKIEWILKNFYTRHTVQYEEIDDSVYLDNILIGKRMWIKTDEIYGKKMYTNKIDDFGAEYNVIKIIKNFYIEGREVFKEGEIYNAPYCLLKMEWEEPSLLKRISDLINSKRIMNLAIKEMEKQIEFSNLKIYELHSTLAEIDEFNRTLEQKILDSTAELEDKNTELKSFLGKVSHELRTPLNAIIGYSNMLIDNESDEEKLRKLNIIYGASEKLLRFANEIVTFSNLEAKQLEINYDKVSIVKILENIKEFKMFELKRKDLFFEYDADEVDEIITDEHKLFQVINNIVENAIKFTENGGIYITCKNLNGEVLIEIADTGMGIPESQKSNVFNVFERLDSQKEGFGLGLPIVKMIVEAMEGDIRIESKINVGTNFFIRLPDRKDKLAESNLLTRWIKYEERSEKEKNIFYMAINDLVFLYGKLRKAVYRENITDIIKFVRIIEEISGKFLLNEIHNIIEKITEEKMQISETTDFIRIKKELEELEKIVMSINYEEIPYSEFIENKTNQKLRVLVVDDNRLNQNLIKEFLLQININCDIAENGSEALKMMQRKNYQKVIMDIEMPVLNGEETIKIIRAEKKYSIVEIIALTATATVGSKERYIKMGFDDYLSKPVNKNILYRMLNLEQNNSIQ